MWNSNNIKTTFTSEHISNQPEMLQIMSGLTRYLTLTFENVMKRR